MNVRKNIFQSLTVVLIMVGAIFGQTINVTFGDSGVSSLKWGNTQLVGSLGSGMLTKMDYPAFSRANKTTYTLAPGKPTSVSVNSSTGTITNVYTWGIVSCRYVNVSSTGIDVRVVVQNTTTDTLIRAKGQFLGLETPQAALAVNSGCYAIACGDAIGAIPAQGFYRNDPSADGGPGVTLFGLGNVCSFAMFNLGNPLRSLYWEVVGGSPEVFLRWAIGSHIAPNTSSDTCVIGLRFGASGITLDKLGSLGAEGFMRFAGYYPSRVNWPDRRPIGVNFISSTSGSSCASPNTAGWFNCDRSINTTTTQGLENFRTRILANADACIANTRKINGQGVIIWDIEGGRYQGIMYPGDPDMIDSLAPEMAYKGSRTLCIVDEYMKKISDAGLLPGLCIRPQKIIRTSGAGNSWGDNGSDLPDPGQEILNDVDYAYRRWGVRLYYMDSNVANRPGSVIPASEIFDKVFSAHPNILIAGEWSTTNYYQWSSIYEDYHFQTANTTQGVRFAYPDAFSTIYADLIGQSAACFLGARKGDIYMTNIWFGDKSQDTLAKFNNILGKRPTASITFPANNSLITSPSLTISATANDSDGTISKVEFLSAGIVLGSDNTAPYSFDWTWTLPGRHMLSARAVDNKGNASCSRPVSVVLGKDPFVTNTATNYVQTGNRKLLRSFEVTIFTLDGKKVRSINNVDGTFFPTISATRGLPQGIYLMTMYQAGQSIITKKIIALK